MDPTVEADLLTRARTGDRDAMGALCAAHHGLVVRLASRRARPGVELDDLIAEGQLAAVRAIPAYRPGEGHRGLGSWIGYLVSQALTALLEREERVVSVAREADTDETWACTSDTAGEAFARLDGEVLVAALAALPSDLRAVVALRHGLGGEEPLTLREVAEILDRSHEWVRRREAKALAALRAAVEGREVAPAPTKKSKKKTTTKKTTTKKKSIKVAVETASDEVAVAISDETMTGAAFAPKILSDADDAPAAPEDISWTPASSQSGNPPSSPASSRESGSSPAMPTSTPSPPPATVSSPTRSPVWPPSITPTVSGSLTATSPGSSREREDLPSHDPWGHAPRGTRQARARRGRVPGLHAPRWSQRVRRDPRRRGQATGGRGIVVRHGGETGLVRLLALRIPLTVTEQQVGEIEAALSEPADDDPQYDDLNEALRREELPAILGVPVELVAVHE